MNSIELSIDRNLYSEVVLTKSVYWLTDKYIPEITLSESNFVLKVSRNDHNDFSEEEKQKVIDKVKINLIDFKLRAQIDRETKNIRELIIAKAFSHGEFDEDPPGEISDPVGFNIKD